MNTLPLNSNQHISHQVNVPALLRRMDGHALEQLCAEVARLAEMTERLAAENDHLRRELADAEDCAEGWREDAMTLHEQLAVANGGMRGITPAGELVIVAQHDGDLQDIDAPLSPEDTAWINAWLSGNEHAASQPCLQEGAARG